MHSVAHCRSPNRDAACSRQLANMIALHLRWLISRSIRCCSWLLLSNAALITTIKTAHPNSASNSVLMLDAVPSTRVLGDTPPALLTGQQQLNTRAWPREGNLCHAQGPYPGTDIPRFVWQQRRCYGLAQRWWVDYCYPGIQYVHGPRPAYTELYYKCPRGRWCWNLNPDDQGHLHISCRPIDEAFDFEHTHQWQVDPDDEDHARQGSWTALQQEQERQRQQEARTQRRNSRLAGLTKWLSRQDPDADRGGQRPSSSSVTTP